MTATVHAEPVGEGQVLVAVEIQRGSTMLATPKVICAHGEPAVIELIEEGRSVHVHVTPPASASDEIVTVEVHVEDDAGTSTQVIEVPLEGSETAHTSVD